MVSAQVSSCPSCKKIIKSSIEAMAKGMLKPGTYMVCTGCGEISIYNQELTLHKITDEELADKKTKCPEAYHIMIKLSQYFKDQKASKN